MKEIIFLCLSGNMELKLLWVLHMSKSSIEQDEVFEYDIDVGYEENFEKWLRWNNRERRLYGEKERTVEEGKKIFRSIYGGV
jgi:hypothetical protein